MLAAQSEEILSQSGQPRQKNSWGLDLNDKGWATLNIYVRYLLLHGPRKTTKTNAALNRIARHLFEVDGSRLGFVAITRQSAKSGAWETLTNFILDKLWIEAGSGMKWGKKGNWDGRPRMAADTRMTHFRIRNMHGGFSEGQLHSLDNENEVEEKFKNTNFSIIYVSEADLFKRHKTFATLRLQLRGMGPKGYLPFEDHMMICDCNPPEEGVEHPLHDMFFKKVDVSGNPLSEDEARHYMAVAWDYSDNIWMSAQERKELEQAYAYDEQTYRRLIQGEWVRDKTRGLFADVFIPNVHIVGERNGPVEANWDVLVPSEHTFRFWTGWDPGDISHAAIIGCTEEIDGELNFLILDELVTDRVSLADFTEAICEKMNWWEKLMRNLYKRSELLWQHYADSSVVRWKASLPSSECTMIEYSSLSTRGGHGSIRLRGVPKPQHSVLGRVRQLRALLFERRLRISILCPNVRKMFEGLMGGKFGSTTTLEPGQEEKHVFDALSYPLTIEAPFYQAKRVSEPGTANMGIVQMPMENRRIVQFRR